MAEQEHPQLYLITPPEIDLETFPEQLARVLDSQDIACLRVALSTQNEDQLSRAAETLRELCYPREIALVISQHVLLAQRLGLDGVHLTDGARSVRKVRKDLGEDAIVGSFCGASRHDGMTAGESGADYISFGPVRKTPLGDGTLAERALFEWWSQMIEVPVVAEGTLDLDATRALAPVTDFFALGSEIWSSEDPVATLASYVAAMR